MSVCVCVSVSGVVCTCAYIYILYVLGMHGWMDGWMDGFQPCSKHTAHRCCTGRDSFSPQCSIPSSPVPTVYCIHALRLKMAQKSYIVWSLGQKP